MDKNKALSLLDGATADLIEVYSWLESWRPPSRFPDFPLYGQQWLPWRYDKLGYSNYSTIGAWGCVVASAAMVVSDVMDKRVTPRDVNRRMKEVGGFVDTNLFVFSALERAYPAVSYDGFVRSEDVAAPVDRIDAHVQSNGYVVAEVDLRLITGGIQQHWLVLYGGSSTLGYWATDPWIGTYCLLPPAYCDMGHRNPTAARWLFGAAFYSRK